MSDTYVLGLDTSRYQIKVDWAKAKEAGVLFSAIRATIGDYYQDPTFEDMFDNSQKEDIATTAYHVYAGKTSRTGRKITPEAEVARYLKALGNRTLDIPPVLDCELNRGLTRLQISKDIWSMGMKLRGYQGHELPFIYTNANFSNSAMSSQFNWSRFPLWVANYTKKLSPVMPVHWNIWFIWQFTDKAPGAAFGASSNHVDVNRMTKTTAEALGILQGEPEEPPEPVEPPNEDNYIVSAKPIRDITLTEVEEDWKATGSNIAVYALDTLTQGRRTLTNEQYKAIKEVLQF